jgi:hypothetical protein
MTDRYGRRAVEHLLLPLSTDGDSIDTVIAGAYYCRA